MTRHGWLSWPIHRPRVVLLAAVMICGLSIISAMRLTPNVSLSAMLADDAPSAAAMQRIADRYRAMDELLLVASVPGSIDQAPSRAMLLAFAQRLEQRVAEDAAVSAMITRISYAIEDDDPEQQFVREVIVPNMLLYVDEADFDRARERLTLDAMREQISRNETMIAAPGPAAGSLSRQLLRDPLRLREMLSLDALLPQDEDGFFSEDGRSLLVRITGVKSAGDLQFTDDLLAAVQTTADAVNEDQLVLEYAGAYAIAAASHHAIRSDMIRSVIGSVLLIQLFLLLVYRRAMSFVLALAPVAVAIVTAFGVFALLSAHVTPVTAVIGAVLAGLGIDYCVHMLSHYERQRSSGVSAIVAAGETMRSVGPRTTAAAATTLIGFLAISQSYVNALRDFAILGGLGLACALVASLTVLPSLLVMTDRRAESPGSANQRNALVQRLMMWIAAHRGMCLGGAVAVLGLCLVVLAVRPDRAVVFEADLTSMHPQPNPALDLQHRLGERFAGSGETMLLHLRADSTDALVTLSHDVATRLETAAVRDAGVLGTYSPATWLPDGAIAMQRISELQRIDPQRVVADFQTAIDESMFDLAAYDEYVTFLRELVRPAPPGVDRLRAYPPLAQTLLPNEAEATDAISLVLLERTPTDRTQRDHIIHTLRQALSDLPDGAVTLTGLNVVGHDTEAAIRRDAARLLMFAAVAVLVFLLILFRRPVDVLLTLLPTAFGLAVLLAVMNAMGQGFNMINLIALPLLCGIGVDDGIFMMTIARRHKSATAGELARKLLASTHAVIVTTVTTMLAFGSLMFTSTPAIQSLGWMAALGVGACLLGTLGLLVPLLLMRQRNEVAA